MTSYDAWKTDSGREDDERLYPDGGECDCCGRGVPHLTRLWAYGIETFACDECRGIKDEEECK